MSLIRASDKPIPDILRRKWQHFAYCLDHNKDGLVTRQDHQELAERAIVEGNLDPNSLQAKQIRRKLGQVHNS